MSSTATAILSPTSSTSDFVHISSSCPQCGAHISASLPPHALHSEEAHLRIQDLEAQVKLLNAKAAAAVDRLADYEDEVRYLRAQQTRSQGGNGFVSPRPESQVMQPPQSQSRLSSFTSSFLPGRRGGGTPIPPVPPTPNSALHPPPSPFPQAASPQYANASTPNLPSHSSDLSTALEAERRARLTAESTLSQTQSELEDLTAKLFGEANEMVATERRARAKLEERVAVLEKRDSEKRRRLDRLEKALERIERVRGMVGNVR